jgi:hypothetical protein
MHGMQGLLELTATLFCLQPQAAAWLFMMSTSNVPSGML